jgi:pimeloyl-ACP methyl ester carboxylesterase
MSWLKKGRRLAILSFSLSMLGAFSIFASNGVAADLTIVPHQIPVRPGVSLPVLSIVPKGILIRATLVLFPGGRGVNVFEQVNGGIELNQNFLPRIAYGLARKGFRILLLDSPSDQVGGMSDEFRISPTHVDDVKTVVRTLAGPAEPIGVVGTSRGCLSAAAVALGMGAAVKKLVLTAAVAENPIFRSLPFGRVKTSTLFIHHKLDGCPSATPRSVQALVGGLSEKIPIELTMVDGGRKQQSDPCRPLTYHGFFQLEAAMIGRISASIFK